MKALALLLLWAVAASPAILQSPCTEIISFKNCENATFRSTVTRETIRYGFDMPHHRCIPFPHRDHCGPRENSFVSKAECERICGKPSDFCSKPLVQGPCLATLRRFGYDPKSKKCVRFNYGGCDGNENNFATMIECRETCRDDSTYDPADVCNLPAERGPCLSDYPSYAYDSKTRKCIQFSYGGCGGNGNRFETEKECLKTCFKSEEDVCSLPTVVGPCTAAFQRFTYNSTLQKCVPFVFGGCEGNANNFESLQDCQAVCGGGETKPVPKPSTSVCKLSIETGPCAGDIKRYGYDVKQQKCVLFKYGGCLGNENNFKTLQDCESLCYGVVEPNAGTESEDICSLPITVGPCRGCYRRYGYDSSHKKCVMFVFGGCHGNANNFRSLAECEAACGKETKPSTTIPAQCLLPVKVGPCRGEFPRYAYDSAQKKCVFFVYGGCRGNTNRFRTLSECQSVCMEDESTTPAPVSPGACILPISQGPCRGNFSRYGYDSVQKKCVEYIYGGCRGNQNRFETLSDCQAVCEGEVSTPAPEPSPEPTPKPTPKPALKPKGVCSLAIDKGPCTAHIPSYAYDKNLWRCVRFVYGGCEGNENRFETLEDCRLTCEKGVTLPFIHTTATPSMPVPEGCLLPIESGPCMDFQPRYAYDDSHKRCVRFIYGGCRGNENRFRTLEDCLSTCMGVKPPQPTYAPTTPKDCLLPIDGGACLAHYPSYGYDSAQKKCVPFIYGGCGGNKNRFFDKELCEAICMGIRPTPEPTTPSSLPSSGACAQPIAQGSCKETYPRYAYESSLRTCVRFVYSGCQGNDNNFKTLEECESTCLKITPTPIPIPTPSPDVCSLPIVKGPCKGLHKRFAYDNRVGKCIQFIYGGCQGNENNFESLKDCQSVCTEGASTPAPTSTTTPPQPTTSVCSLPIETGPCLGLIPSYAYDTKLQKCVEFKYGGCQGNENRFDSLEECESACGARKDVTTPRPIVVPGAASTEICTLPVDVGPCTALFYRYYYSTRIQKCIPFYYGGCLGNDNNFKTLEECVQTCGNTTQTEIPSDGICQQPIKRGSCLALMTRYAYNNRLQKCVEFIYGGCEGNDNNFETMEDCEATCEQKDTSTTTTTTTTSTTTTTPATEIDICQLPPDSGYCKLNMLRYAYVATEKKCVPLIYGGCGGNQNNFISRRACEARCMKSSTNVCTQPIEVGPCNAFILRYAFDVSTQSCTLFFYGGCEGNGNNFESNEECASVCEQKKTSPDDAGVCAQSIETGTCKGQFKRYAYDSTTRTCVQFVYGGCGGNTNNFDSWEQCASACGLSATPEPGYVCELDIDVGPCKSNITRYAYEKTTKQCVRFTYGGCKGNGNNFETMQECTAQCVSQSEEDICSLPIDVGIGSTFLVVRYGYDSRTGECRPFHYTLIGGNKNRFYTKAQCEKVCGTTTSKTTPSVTTTTTSTTVPSVSSDRCTMSIEVGPCKSFIARYAYNPATRTCILFYYGGCLGNGNRFTNLRECQFTCMYKSQIPPIAAPWDHFYRCLLPIKRGNCNDRLIRYGYSYYDCIQFEYTGCGGNANNFETLDECRKTCGWYNVVEHRGTEAKNQEMKAPRRRRTKQNN